MEPKTFDICVALYKAFLTTGGLWFLWKFCGTVVRIISFYRNRP